MLEALIMAALAIAEILYIGLVILLLIEEIINWFGHIKNKTPYDIGFTVKEALDSGKCRIIQGVFNKISNEVTASRSIDAKKLDKTLEDYHKNNPVVVYS